MLKTVYLEVHRGGNVVAHTAGVPDSAPMVGPGRVYVQIDLDIPDELFGPIMSKHRVTVENSTRPDILVNQKRQLDMDGEGK